MKYVEPIGLLSRLANSQNLPHAILFTGADTETKKEAALKFSKWLFHLGRSRTVGNIQYEKFSEFYDINCDCNLCAQVDRRLYPDFLYLEHSPVQIGEIRSLKNKLSVSPLLSDKKIAVISHMESMRVEAANSLLKLLEEPHGNALIVLVAPSRSRVLSTIASRTIEIKFPDEIGDLTKRYANHVSAEQLETIGILENGLLEEKFALAKKYNIENKSELLDIIDIWLTKIRGEIFENFNKDYVDFAKRIFWVKKILATTNANPQLLLEDLILNHA